VYEDNDRLVVVVEIAGMQRGKINVVLDERHLTISGARPQMLDSKPAFHQMEVRHGEFRVDVNLPWLIEEEAVEASYDDGFLRVELPKAQAHHVRVDVEKPDTD
jgi:HSP20 family protein